ncbi:MAG: hypothetical protein AAFS12_17245 [Cyanobacteria bacterium J06632_19]
MSSSPIDNHAATVAQMVADGHTLKEIIKKLRELGCKVTLKALQKYLDEQGLKIQNAPIVPEVMFVRGSKDSNSNSSKEPDVERFNSRSFNFDNADLSDDFDAVALAEFLQKAHYFLYKRQLEIVANEQEAYYLGYSDSQPIHSLRKLQILADLFYKIAPVHIISNQREAIKVIQRMGYTISVDGENINVDNTTDPSTD